jgi:serine protease AprX
MSFRLTAYSFCFTLLTLAVNPLWGTASKIPASLQQRLASCPEDEAIACWIFFADKGTGNAKSSPEHLVTERSLARRAKVIRSGPLVDDTDLPVEPLYVEEVAARVLVLRHRSRWFNAVSVLATSAQIRSVARLDVVAHIDLMGRFRRQEDLPPTSAPLLPLTKLSTQINYGQSFSQLAQINVPLLHETGNYGQGVLVGVFDDGFRLLNHEAFTSLDIVGTYDFVDHKIGVAPNNPSSAFGWHGVNVLSNIAGYAPGELIGPAFGASYLLARTENDSSETPIEEDNWIAAIEWADSLGVDVTSTSLGYLVYDAPYGGYTWENLDGNTTMITRAADMAVAKGIIVVNSAGNNGFNGTHNTLNAPADGDSVLTVGSVNADGTRSGFSSVGPTTSSPPRIKPDVMALGAGVKTASATDPSAYIFPQGTSHACPLVAGVVALLLHARPSAPPMEIIDALRATASRSATPDNQYGWGIVDAVAALQYLGGQVPPSSYNLAPPFPNPFNPSVSIPVRVRYDIPRPSRVTLVIYDLLGRKIRTLIDGDLNPSSSFAIWDGRNETGYQVASGTYFYVLTASALGGGSGLTESRKLLLVR